MANDSINQVTVFTATTPGMKWWFSIFLGLLFILLSLPSLYYLSGFLIFSPAVNSNLNTTKYYLPLIFLHGLIFTLITRLILW